MRIQKPLRIVALLSAAVVVSATVSAQAQTPGVQFSAEMLTHGPDAPPTTGKMFVGDGRVRIEMVQDGREIVRISDHQRRMDWVLFPEQKNYIEHAASQGVEVNAAPAVQPSAETNPCTGLQNVTCQRIGEEAVAGRPAIKWEMLVTRDGKTLTGTQWLDVERGLPLKYQMPNGQSMELTMLGSETLNGRTVEKWEMTTVLPNQPPMQSTQWYDPELKLEVRAEFPGGYVRELSNIVIGPQPDALFSIPADYVTMPPPEQPPQIPPFNQGK